MSDTRRQGKSSPGLLRVHLLGQVDFDEVMRLQRQLVYELQERQEGGALVFCEHPPVITVGRHGSPAQIRADLQDLALRGWLVRWVPRGGGAILHLPGQLAIYPILPLSRLGLDIPTYLQRLQQILLAVLKDFGVHAQTRPGSTGLWVQDRPIALVGVAVRQQISTFGITLNIDPDVTLFRLVQTNDLNDRPMTSLARERRGPLRPALVRQRVLEHFQEGFGFDQLDLIFSAPGRPGHERLPAPS